MHKTLHFSTRYLLLFPPPNLGSFSSAATAASTGKSHPPAAAECELRRSTASKGGIHRWGKVTRSSDGGSPGPGRRFLIGERVSEQRPHEALEGQLRGVTLPTLAADPGQRAKVTATRAGQEVQEVLPTSRCPCAFSSVILSSKHSAHTNNHEIKSWS